MVKMDNEGAGRHFDVFLSFNINKTSHDNCHS